VKKACGSVITKPHHGAHHGSTPRNGSNPRTSTHDAEDTVPLQSLDLHDKDKVANDFLRRRLSKQNHKMMKKDADSHKSAEGRNPSKGENEEEPESVSETHDLRRMQRLGVLGEGSFGTVLLMEDTVTKTNYALKALLKSRIKTENLGLSVQSERTVMMLVNDSDFIVRLFTCYQDSGNIFFVLEPVFGGELFDVYNEHDMFGSIAHAKFYIACVALGLQHMHQKRVIFRDLKLENCLLDAKGFLKLTDMGIAKVVIGKTYTVCGTADYFAPETLRQAGHNRAVDWWAAGVLLFIMCAGRSPFDAPEVTQIYKNIMKGFSKVKFPDTFPSDLTDVIKSLCRKKPEERLTMQKGGVDNLKVMPFFSGLSWEKLAVHDASITVPFLPPPVDLDSLMKKKTEREIVLKAEDITEWDGTLPQEPVKKGWRKALNLVKKTMKVEEKPAPEKPNFGEELSGA